MGIKVRANAVGYFEQLRQPGDEFEIESKDQLGKWMDVVKTAKAKASTQAAEQVDVDQAPTEPEPTNELA